MANKVEIESMPDNTLKKLAYFYMESQDLTGKTPAEICTMYYDAYYEILKDYRRKLASNWFVQKNKETDTP